MKIYFDNDGSFGLSAIKAPIIVNNKPVGFIEDVDEQRVTCFLFDKYVFKEQIGLNFSTTEQDIRCIGINN